MPRRLLVIAVLLLVLLAAARWVVLGVAAGTGSLARGVDAAGARLRTD
jgi:hypothetical protein